MSNLVTQYGSGWFYQKFSGSFFKHEGESHVILPSSGRRTAWIPCSKLSKQEDGTIVSSTVEVPVTAFSDVSVFSVPNLGWRAAFNGKYLSYYVRNNNSYHRGLSARNLRTSDCAMTRWLTTSQNLAREHLTPEFVAYNAMNPEFLSLTEGVAKMAEGEIASFAVSPTIAVMPDSEDRFLVMFKQKVAGTVTPAGAMSLIIPELSNYMEDM